MRIAMMTNNYKPFTGGVPISVERLAQGLRELGHEVTVFAPTYHDEEKEPGVFRYKTCIQHFIGGIVLPAPFDRRIEQVFEEQAFDVIHVHHPVLIGNTAVRLSRKYQIPLVFTYHTRYEKYLREYTGNIFSFEKAMKLYLKLFFRRCDFVFAPTEGIGSYLTDKCGVAPEKTGVLPTGLLPESYEAKQAQSEEIRRAYGAEACPLLLTVSRMAREKNLEFLLEALAQAKALYRKPFRALFVGDGPDRELLEKKRDALGLEDTVFFTGSFSNQALPPYYKAADGFVFASKTETQGIVLLEAFAGKTPVIAVRASGVEDLVQDGENGILTGEDTKEYAEKLTRFLCDGKMRARLSENACRAGLSFREEEVAHEALRRYNEVIAERERQSKERRHGKPISYSCS